MNNQGITEPCNRDSGNLKMSIFSTENKTNNMTYLDEFVHLYERKSFAKVCSRMKEMQTKWKLMDVHGQSFIRPIL